MFDFCFNKVNILIHIFAFVLCGNRFIIYLVIVSCMYKYLLRFRPNLYLYVKSVLQLSSSPLTMTDYEKIPQPSQN